MWNETNVYTIDMEENIEKMESTKDSTTVREESEKTERETRNFVGALYQIQCVYV